MPAQKGHRGGIETVANHHPIGEGESRIFGGTFAPQHWAGCDGTITAISQNESLFSLIGIAYGGDGRSSFALPDLRGRAAMHQGTGIGLTPRQLGTRFGTEDVTLSLSELPAHTHDVQASTNAGTLTNPTGAVTASSTASPYYTANDPTDSNKDMAANIVAGSGGDKPHTNLMPYLVMNFIITLQGFYPSRN